MTAPSGPSLGQRLLAAATALEDFARWKGKPEPDDVLFSARTIRNEVKSWSEA